MKKRRNLAAAFLLSAVMTASVCTTAMPVMSAFAADYTITINKPDSDKATHTYVAYQVFQGDISGSGADTVLSNITWGSGVNGEALLTALKASTAFGTSNAFADCTTAAAVADVLDEWENDAAMLQKFADIVGQNLAAAAVTGTEGNPKLTVNAPGYYFIKDVDASQDDSVDGAYTDYILQVLGSVEISAKEDVPAITKKIDEGGTLTEANTASIGDTVNFQLDSAVPDMSAYNRYYFIINDDMCEGLTFQSDSVKIYINEQLISSSYYEVQTGDAADGHTFQIVMKDFKARYGEQNGDPITVTYSAVLNEKCDRTTAGNQNTVGLTYSNNPNHQYVGENEPTPDEPGEPSTGDVTGKTPESKTKTYTTGILLKKIDGAEKTRVLPGAKFRLTGAGVNQVIMATAESFTADANGEYYKLKDGTYTLVAPTDQTEELYDDTEQKYKLTVEVTTHTDSGENSYVETVTDEKGILTFAGLGAGTYTLTEIEAPAGYNKLANPITIEISAEPTLEGPNWTILQDGSALTAPTGIYEFEVENNKGTTLPGTGGIGTTIFYIIGGSLIAVAVILFITKKRMSVSEEK